uniref:Uncharacterized protein n=1 Tax=Ciona savignyi TaxID=51511 RepID=H2YC88_CIOSA
MFSQLRKISSNQNSWDLSKYRYFMPYQTRWRDDGENKSIQNSVYMSATGNIIMSFQNKLKNANHLQQHNVEMAFESRGDIGHPTLMLAGLGVERLGNTSVVYKVGVFKPFCDFHVNLDRFGEFPHQPTMASLEKKYEGRAVAVMRAVNVFIEDGKPTV